MALTKDAVLARIEAHTVRGFTAEDTVLCVCKRWFDTKAEHLEHVAEEVLSLVRGEIGMVEYRTGVDVAEMLGMDDD